MYVIGCDFGTISMRCVVVDAANGRIAAESVYEYPHGVITEKLPGCDVKLEGHMWALQHPEDYLNALKENIPQAVRLAGVDPAEIAGIGVDFTTCTVVPMKKNGDPLCTDPEFRERPHAWVKLWKNHTAQKEADDITEYVRRNKLNVLDNNGYTASSEYFFPKVLEIFRKDRVSYDAAYTYMEGGDFVVSRLCGEFVRSGVQAGAKGFYDNELKSYPDKSFFRGLDPDFENVVEDKHLTNVKQVGSLAGNLTPEMAHLLGLPQTTAVCVAHADAAVAIPGCGVVEPNIMTFIMGTSTCHLMMATEKVRIPDIDALFYEGVLPGYYTYETGQSATGDIFEWFCKNYLPERYTKEAEARNISPMALMDEKAAAIKSSTVVALDWMNGNRCLLHDSDLSGLIMGMTLSTKPEEVYRALLEATAFGTKIIIDRFEEYGVPIKEAYACGGLAHKSPVYMQIYADVLNIPITVAAYKHTSALASALFAAVAAGLFKSYKEAAKVMIAPPDRKYTPDPTTARDYKKLFSIYKRLHDYFGIECADLMKI